MDKKRILIADDEVSIRLTVGRLLENDYIVLEAANGAEAVEIAKGQKPDLILMDLIMPKVDGYTACSQIKADQETRGIPVIVLTAIGHELNKKYATEMGAAGYLTKPFNVKELLTLITTLLAEESPPESQNCHVDSESLTS
ncbi:MAG: response regulator [Chloroflexota bacterium]|nr:MAG: response regulator [Chloroflexota bacterium]